MKKIVVIAGAAFLISLAAGAVGRMALAPPPSEEDAAVAAGETSDAAGEHGEGAISEDAHADSETADGHGSGDGQESASGHGAEPGAEGLDHAVAVGDLKDRPFEFREMGHILSSMEPREAGMFLSYLDDERAMGLLRAMSVGDAAAALAHVPDERKAQLKACLMGLLMEEE